VGCWAQEGTSSWCQWEPGTALLFSRMGKKGVAKLCTLPASLLHPNPRLSPRGDECNLVFCISCFAALFLTSACVFRCHQKSLLCVLGADGVDTRSLSCCSAQGVWLTAGRRPRWLFGDGQLADVTRTSPPEKSARTGVATGCFPFPKVSKTF